MESAPPLCRSLCAVVAVPPVCDFYFTRHRFSSLGAKTVNQILLNLGLKAIFLDFASINKHPKVIDLPQDIGYLRKYVIPDETGSLSFFTKYQLFGPEPHECAAKICAFSPAICFLSCFAYSYAEELLAISRNIKKRSPHTFVVAGGAGVSAYPLYFIRDSSINFAIVGEAERSLPSFVSTIINNHLTFERVPNVFWKKNGIVVPPAEIVPAPSETIEPVVSRTYESRNSVHFSSSLTRGCPKQCRFCSNSISHGTEFRVAGLERLENAFNRLKIHEILPKKALFFNFEDDNLLLDPAYFLKIMSMIRSRFPQARFLAENGLDHSLLSFDLADQLIEAGLAGFNFTFGSANDEVLSIQNRFHSLDRFASLVRHISGKGIGVLSYFIAGLKGDTKQNVVESLAFLGRLPTRIGISMFYAVPGLTDFRETVIFDRLSPKIGNGSSAYPWNSTLTTSELVTAFRLSRYINLLKSKKKSDLELRLIEKIKDEKKLLTLVNDNKAVTIVEVPNLDKEMVSLLLKQLE